MDIEVEIEFQEREQFPPVVFPVLPMMSLSDACIVLEPQVQIPGVLREAGSVTVENDRFLLQNVGAMADHISILRVNYAVVQYHPLRAALGKYY